MAKSSIEWTGETWNPLAGCSEISPGCLNCYAAVMAQRLAAMGQRKYEGTTKKLANGKVVWTGKITLDTGSALDIPRSRRKATTYFVNSMSDLFHENVPDSFIDRVFATMALASQHTFQVLTKRPERMLRYMTVRTPDAEDPANFGPWTVHDRVQVHVDKMIMGNEGATTPIPWPPNNVWLGVSAEDQQRWDERTELLRQVPAAVRFVSAEPLLGEIDMRSRHCDCLIPAQDGCGNHAPNCQAVHVVRGIHWVIAGGESGAGARPCKVDWIRSIVRQCKEDKVACFVKQLGGKPYEMAADGPAVRTWGDAAIRPNGEFVQLHLRDKKGGDPAEWPEYLRVREMPRTA